MIVFGEQLQAPLETINTRFNYVSLFREKYAAVSPDDPYYDEEYMKTVLSKIADIIQVGIQAKYGVEYGGDLDYLTPAEYLTDMETLYEFLFIRHFENLVDYFKNNLIRNRGRFVEEFKHLTDSEIFNKDIFVLQSKKKFKNFDDVIILHFFNDIMSEIRANVNSAYDMFSEIVNYDLYEEFNTRMSEMLINYGNKVVLNNDYQSAQLYLKPLDDSAVYSEIRNAVFTSYLEGVELSE